MRFLRAALATLGALVLIVTLTPVTEWWTAWLRTSRWDSPAGDTLVVLGAAAPVQPGNLLGYSTYWRAVTAVSSWRSAHFRQIIVTGSDGTAESVADYLTSHGVPAANIRVENRSTTTEENAQRTAELLHDGSGGTVAILSSDFHIRRATAVFQRAGFRGFLVIPVPDAAKRSSNRLLRWEVFLDLTAETAKLTYYYVAGKS